MSSNVDGGPSEAIGSGPEEGAVAQEPAVPASETAAEPCDETARLRTELEAVRADSAQWKDRFLRKAAEFENFRKRSDRDRTDAVMQAKCSVLRELLPVLDGCERALDSFKSGDNPSGLQQYREGVELLYRQTLEVLGRLGVAAIEALGRPFDPSLHEALARVDTLEHEENTVAQELRRGYMFKDRLLRPAQVVVAARPKTAELPRQWLP